MYGGAYVAFRIDFANFLQIFIVPLIERICTDCDKFLVSSKNQVHLNHFLNG